MAINYLNPTGYLTFSIPPAPVVSAASIVPAYAAVANTRALPAGSTPSVAVITVVGEPVVVLLATAAASTTATAGAGASAITVASATGIAVGQAVIGAGIPDGTFVISIASTVITLSRPVTAALSTTTVNFVVPVTGGTGVLVSAWAPLTVAYVTSGFISAICLSGGGRATLNVAVGS